MGSKPPTIVYSMEVPGQQQPASSTKVRRRPEYINGLLSCSPNKLTTMKQLFQASFRDNREKNCFGEVVVLPRAGNSPPQRIIQYLTYGEVQRKVRALATGINELNLAQPVEQVPGQKFRLVGIFSKNCPQWLLVDMACCMYGMVSVPLYHTFGPDNVSYALNHSGIATLFCAPEAYDVLIKTTNLAKLKTVVVFGQPTNEQIQAFKAKKINVMAFNTVLEKGSVKPQEYPEPKPEQCMTFCYTSGTTGQPKAAMFSQANVCSSVTFLAVSEQLKLFSDDVYLSYLPLPHILERVGVYQFFCVGATICFSGGVRQALKEQIELVRPTVLVGVPKVYNKFHDAIKERLKQASGCQKSILESAITTKLENVTKKGIYEHWLYDKIVFNKTKAAFGGRIRYMLSGSAPLLPHVHSFIKVIGACPVFEGYGLTETTAGNFITDSRDPTAGHVGGPSSSVEFKLEDVPEMHYTHLDTDEKGRPYPRGQILIRGPCVFMGYYKDPEKTKESLDKEGWFHTGDIGAILPENGALKLIDRKKNIFKLQHGQYIASEKIEMVYLKRSELLDMFLYGDSTQQFAVAIMVPQKGYIEEMGKELNLTGAFEYLCTHPRIRKQLLTQLNSFAQEEGLESYQQPKNMFLQPVPFQQKGILTNTMKLQRQAAKKMYFGQINAMYREGMFVDKEK